MPVRPFGYDVVWGSEPPPEYQTFAGTALPLAAAAAVGAGAFGVLTHTRTDKTRLIDAAVREVQLFGNISPLSPFQILHTFRLPEFASPFTSSVYQGLKAGLPGQRAGMMGMEIAPEYLGTRSTFKYLQKLTGLSDARLAQAGIFPKMQAEGSRLASGLYFERDPTRSAGSLYTMVGGERRDLADFVSLMKAHPERLDYMSSNVGMNRAMKGMLQAMDMFNVPGFKEKQLFRSSSARERLPWVPVHGVGLPRTAQEAHQLSYYPRSVMAFEAQRFNQLREEVVTQFFGETGKKFVKNVLGMEVQTLPGPALNMMRQYGFGAAKIGAVGLGVAQLDWLRRQGGVWEPLGATALAGGAGLLASKVGFGSKASLGVAAASFFGLMTLPEADSGIIPGIYGAYARASVARASAVNPVNYYRRSLEGFFPGISDWKTGILLGTLAGAASYSKIPIIGQRKMSEIALAKIGHKALGIPERIPVPIPLSGGGVMMQEAPLAVPRTLKETFYENLSKELGGGASYLPHATAAERSALRGKFSKKFSNRSSYLDKMNQLWVEAEEQFRQAGKLNPWNYALQQRLDEIASKWSIGAGEPWLFKTGARAAKQAEGLVAQATYSFFGAQPYSAKNLTTSGFWRPFNRFASVVGGVFLAHQLLTGGLLGSMEDAETLRKQYSGEEWVPVRRGRWWEGGGTPYDGTDIKYFRPSAVALAVTRSRQKGIWGEDEPSPLGKFYRKHFTHHLERMHYYDRPYPLCLHPRTGIWTSEGLKEIQEICIGDKVLNREGVFTTVLGISSRNAYEKELYEIQVAGNNETLLVTSEHPVLVVRPRYYEQRHGRCRNKLKTIQNNEPQWIKAKDLQKSDLVLLPAPKTKHITNIVDLAHSTVSYTDNWVFLDPRTQQNFITAVFDRKLSVDEAAKEYGESPGSIRDLRGRIDKDIYPARMFCRFFCIDQDMALFLGYWLAEGWRGKKKGNCRISFVFHEAETDYVDHVCKIAKEKFNTKAAVSHKEGKAVSVRFSSVLANHLLKILFGNQIAVDKKIPRQVFGWSHGLKIAFLTGLLRGDGHYAVAKKEIVLVSASRDLIYGARALLLSIGLKSSVRKIVPSASWKNAIIDGRKIKKTISWSLSITGSDFKRFANAEEQLPNDVSVCVDRKGILIDGVMYAPIRSIHTVPYAGEVFDIQVAETASFMTHVCVVHNSDPAFSSIPIIGPVLGATVGRLVKPPKVMHSSEWMRPNDEGDIEYASLYRGGWMSPSYELGGLKPGTPSAPWGAPQLLGFLNYQYREMTGLTGFVKNTIQEALTGQETIGINARQLATSGLMTDPRTMFWDMELGGGFFMTEIVRRVLPRTRPGLETTNPIMNSMPGWMPSKFHYGDPYREIPWGEARLPGAGYAAMYPELKNVPAEGYPLIHQYNILSSVSPYSQELFRTRTKLYRKRAAGQTSRAENRMMDEIDSRLRQKYNVYEHEGVHPEAIMLPGSGVTRSMWNFSLSALRHAAAPGEYLMPFGARPFQKLLSTYRSPIEQYEYQRLYGTMYSMWDSPIRDWLRPSVWSAAHLLGFRGKPAWRAEADAHQEYFDKLEFVKWMQLAQEAEASGHMRDKNLYMRRAASTRYGVNPQGSPLAIYFSLPYGERPFFNEFALAKGRERDRILKMVPRDQTHLYKAVWSQIDKGTLTWPESKSAVDDQYLVQRFHEVQDYFASKPYPPEDWIGWEGQMDIEDIRLKYVDELGKDVYDYGLWESGLRKTRGQPYLEGSTEFLYPGGLYGLRAIIGGELHRQLTAGHKAPWISVHDTSLVESDAKFIHDDFRDQDVYRQMQSYLNAY